MKISYGITVHNEADELNKLLEILIHKTDPEDEIVICVDGDDDGVRFVLDSWTQQYAHAKMIKVYQRKLDNDFSAQKNSVIENSTGDYIFHIDADEYPHEILLLQLKQIIEMNEGVDLIWIPRVNTVSGFTGEDVQRWGWKISEKGWVNYPDYQARVFRNDKSVRWTRPLHEYITGCKTYAHLPPQEELSLYHPKTKEKQEAQNKFYMDNFSRDLLVRDGVKKKFKPISLGYFLNMEVASGGISKTILNRNDKLKTVRDIVEFYSKEENINLVSKELQPNNWQYFNCMLAEFRHNVEDHHKLGWENMTKEYYESLDIMSDDEIAEFNRQLPVDFDNGFMKHGYHRGYAMIGRLIKGKSYIPFYMREERIYNVPWKNDGVIRTAHPLSYLKKREQLNQIDKAQYCLTQSSILSIMGIRENTDLDIIISSKVRADYNIGGGYHKIDDIEIFPRNYDKFMINGAKNDDDIIQNYTFEFEGYRFLEPRFYFSRKNKNTDRDKSDWEGIRKFFDMGSHIGFPFDSLTDEQWGVQYA